MKMTVESTPYSLEIIQATAVDHIFTTNCPDLGAAYDPPPITFPTDFVVAPMVGTFECGE